MRFPSAACRQTSSTGKSAGGASHPSLALIGWNSSDVSRAWPGDQLDEEDEDWAGAPSTQTNVTASAMKFPIRNMTFSFYLRKRTFARLRILPSMKVSGLYQEAKNHNGEFPVHQAGFGLFGACGERKRLGHGEPALSLHRCNRCMQSLQRCNEMKRIATKCNEMQ